MHDQATWLKGSGKGRRDVRILFTSAGRRIELIQAFTRAARSLGLKPHWHTADVDPYIATGCLAEKVHLVPKAQAPGYIPALRRIVRQERIDLIIPLIDSDLLKLADARDEFARLGCGALISSPQVVRTCRDKRRMFEFLTRHDIDTPATWTADQILRSRTHRFPYFLKPRFGSASKKNYVVADRNDLKSLLRVVPDPLVQEFVSGVEHTLDVYTGFDGRPRCVVPRERIEVRGGEVTKARTVRHQRIIQTGVRVAEALTECIGLITIQLILTPKGRIRVIEVNPRFGGGVPLGIRAGADFPKWLLAEWLGRKPRIRLDQFDPNLLMLRYHQSFFMKATTYPKGWRRILRP
ncbi:MAG TPA: ATP-grasp domain-containing protein [Phycisphaerae bacterium]|nr:ATP-grasp domain-containing protein [Phycisphaerae bacterium]